MFISGRISINVIRPDTNILVYFILTIIVNHKLFYMFGIGLELHYILIVVFFFLLPLVPPNEIDALLTSSGSTISTVVI